MPTYFDDIEFGKKYESEEKYVFTDESIKNFAREWDPMPFHLDDEMAKHSPMGKLFASGAQLVAVAIKLGHTIKKDQIMAVAGLGWDEVRFLKPVFAGDIITLHSENIDKRLSKSNPNNGIVTSQMTLVNQHGEKVLSYKISSLVMRKV